MKKFISRFRKITIVVVLVSGIIAGLAFTDNKFEVTKNLDIFITMFKELNNYYVDDIDPAKLIKKGIDAMLASLDPYTVFIPESDAEDYRFMTSGSYGGIGAMVEKKGEYVQIADPYEGFPAQKAGLRAGDIIVSIDGKSTKGLTVNDVSTLLKGQAETKVEVEIDRPGIKSTIKVSLVRENIKMKNVPYYGMVSDSVGYIYLSNFRENASDDVKKAFNELKSQNNLKGLILDLRGNPGGLLFEAVKVVNIFVEKGQLVVSTKGKVEENNKDYKAYDNPLDKNIPLVVLVNENSASASEIVSGALQDLDRAVIIGSRTFGKGLVQITRKLTYNTQMKLTTSKYYIPSGRCIQALDYSHKDASGRAVKIPDSLITAFKTKNGRTVYDGAGITPDIKVSGEKYPELVNILMSQRIIFDYATDYRNRHDSIPPPEIFSFTDDDYNDFIAFTGKKEIKYKTATEKALEKVELEAKNENYSGALVSAYDTINSRIQAQKKKEIMLYKKEIRELLYEEIVSRYYYQKGRIMANLKSDHDIDEALKIFNRQADYYKLLSVPNEAKK